MTKRFLSQVSFYSVAVALGLYLANGQSANVHVAYVSTSLFATFMSRRRTSSVPAPVSHMPDRDLAPDDRRVMTMAHVEELLSHAS